MLGEKQPTTEGHRGHKGVSGPRGWVVLLNEISGQVVDAAMRVHSSLGPGLLESAYQACLAHELQRRGLKVAVQVVLPVEYDGIRVDAGYRIDLVVENAVIVELKSVEAIAPVHRAQVLSYLRLSRKRLGLLINFNVRHLRDGIERFILDP
jgi:GxxExxY protein